MNQIEKLAILSDVLQIINTGLNIDQTSNQEILEELHKQDREFFNKILEKQEEILSILKSK